MRTYSRTEWETAQTAWTDGEFSDEWREVRHQAAMRGMLFPPDGSKWDSWDDDPPSQRAVIIRAIRETPDLLTKCIARSRSWYEVFAFLTARLNEMRDELDRSDRLAAYERRDEPDAHEASVAIKRILDRIGNS